MRDGHDGTLAFSLCACDGNGGDCGKQLSGPREALCWRPQGLGLPSVGNFQCKQRGVLKVRGNVFRSREAWGVKVPPKSGGDF